MTPTIDPASKTLLNALTTNLLNPAMLLLTGIAGLIFMWGLLQFLWELQKGGDSKEGKQHMLWGTVGLFIMVGAYGIIVILENTVNSFGH